MERTSLTEEVYCLPNVCAHTQLIECLIYNMCAHVDYKNPDLATRVNHLFDRSLSPRLRAFLHARPRLNPSEAGINPATLQPLTFYQSLNFRMVLQKGRCLLHKIKGHFKHKRSPFSSPIANLPPELVQVIATFLDAPEFCSLRLTCKKVYESTLRYFGHSYLRTVKTDLSLNKLQTLESVSQNSSLAPLVHKLVIQAPDEGLDLLGHGILWSRHPSGHISMPQQGIQQWQDVL